MKFVDDKRQETAIIEFSHDPKFWLIAGFCDAIDTSAGKFVQQDHEKWVYEVNQRFRDRGNPFDRHRDRRYSTSPEIKNSGYAVVDDYYLRVYRKKFKGELYLHYDFESEDKTIARVFTTVSPSGDQWRKRTASMIEWLVGRMHYHFSDRIKSTSIVVKNATSVSSSGGGL
ncbi:hypothetical protein [Rhodopirellula europaea]|uniref:hypothetical protein n=1 Tax=Rhodopirellula europaea TaxID=1263866 RepID=UPI001181A4A4|nr:hypothetical protein [Rhodopirellula europaea]